MTKKRKSDDVRPDYRFDYAKAKPNRFAARDKADSRVIVLDLDVARVFKSTQSVNAVLRALLKTMPRDALYEITLLNSPRFLAIIAEGWRQIEAGEYSTHEEFWKRIRAKHGKPKVRPRKARARR